MKLKSLGLFFIMLIFFKGMNAERVYFYHDFHEPVRASVTKSIVASIGGILLLSLGYKLEQKLEQTARATIPDYNRLLAELKNNVEYMNKKYGFWTPSLTRYYVPDMPQFYEIAASSPETAAALKKLYYQSGCSYVAGSVLLIFGIFGLLGD
ncbi:hypothetical protein HYX58_04080 [Candidatus Dependentiae bacterium]|nr:hypothetical protein [Candidatus Dependentiae bacterium]